MVILIFILFVLYTIACCLDGPDLKPRWKRSLGLQLRDMANNLHPIDYCSHDRCRYYFDATEMLPYYRNSYDELMRHIAKMNALNSTPTVFISEYDVKKVESLCVIDECELRQAKIYEQIAADRGFMVTESASVNGILSNAKRNCINSCIDEAKKYVQITEDRESNWPNIVVRGNIFLAKKKKLHVQDDCIKTEQRDNQAEDYQGRY